MKSRLVRKDPDAWKDWGLEDNGTTEDEIIGRHHQHNGHEFEQTLGDGLKIVRHDSQTEK